MSSSQYYVHVHMKENQIEKTSCNYGINNIIYESDCHNSQAVYSESKRSFNNEHTKSFKNLTSKRVILTKNCCEEEYSSD